MSTLSKDKHDENNLHFEARDLQSFRLSIRLAGNLLCMWDLLFNEYTTQEVGILTSFYLQILVFLRVGRVYLLFNLLSICGHAYMGQQGLTTKILLIPNWTNLAQNSHTTSRHIQALLGTYLFYPFSPAQQTCSPDCSIRPWSHSSPFSNLKWV